MAIIADHRAGSIALVLEGVVEAADSPRLRRLLLDGLACGNRLVVDLSRTVRIDTAILATLIEALAGTRRGNGTLALRRVPPSVMALLRLARLDRVFPIDDTPTLPVGT